MRSVLVLWLTTFLTLTSLTAQVRADIKAEIVSTKVVWEQANRNFSSDIVRFKDQWFLVCCESARLYENDEALRVLSSKDGERWESVALIVSPTPGRGIKDPKFALTNNDQLMITAQGIVPNPKSTDPLPMFGGTLLTMGWFAKDGRTWSHSEQIGEENFPFSRVVWNKNLAFSYGAGCICGSAQTIQFYSSKDGKYFTSLFQETFSGFFPSDASIIFDRDRAFCLMSRYDSKIGNAPRTGFLASSKAPYDEWTWKETDKRIGSVNLQRLSEKKIIAAVGLIDQKGGISLCEFDPATGKLNEFLNLPTDDKYTNVGVSMHDEHLWVSYHASRGGKSRVHLAKVKLSQ